MDKEQLRKSVLQRLGTIKGHIAGIEKMVQEEQDCETILFQLTAVMGAVNKLSAHILEGYTQACLNEVNLDDPKARKRVEDLTKTMLMMLKK